LAAFAFGAMVPTFITTLLASNFQTTSLTVAAKRARCGRGQSL
jgi:hypothetical protein